MLKTLLNDLKNGTSHGVDFLKEDSVEETISTAGIKADELARRITQCLKIRN